MAVTSAPHQLPVDEPETFLAALLAGRSSREQHGVLVGHFLEAHGEGERVTEVVSVFGAVLKVEAGAGVDDFCVIFVIVRLGWGAKTAQS